MGRYVQRLTLDKDPTQVEERVRHFLTTYRFVPSKKQEGYEKGNGFVEAKRRFTYRYENGVLTYEAWLGKDLDPSDGKATGALVKKAYMAELASFDEFMLGKTGDLPPVTYSPAGTFIGLFFTVLTILLCVVSNLISLWFPLISLIVTIPGGTKSKVKALAYIVIGVDMLLIVYWILSAVLGIGQIVQTLSMM
ncbi:MAG: hypothetical protein IJ801_01435 [Lachnospiraceae bacterium]|nr:hypothetical protein [Lachnospiraceae bacterium]